MAYTIGICDDCPEQVDLLIGFLDGCGGDGEFRVIHSNDPEAFLETLKTDRPALVFLDIDMEGMDGIELGEKIRELYENIVLIYVTGYKRYAFEAFQLRAFHYLLKPVTREKFRYVLNEALEHIRNADDVENQKTFSVQVRGKMLSLYYGDIYYFEKTGHQIKIHTSSRDIFYYGNLSYLLEELDSEAFVQCHQGYIANIGKIRAFQDKTLFLDGDIKLPVSKSFVEPIRVVLTRHFFARGKQV